MNIFSEVNGNMEWETSEKLAETSISSEKYSICGTNKLISPSMQSQSVSELGVRSSDSHWSSIN